MTPITQAFRLMCDAYLLMIRQAVADAERAADEIDEYLAALKVPRSTST